MLAERTGELSQVGRVGGLGRGERVFAVRFMGDTGYVVTFRQVDPLYTLDLSQPARPRVLGELKIRGYSSYLHPVGPDRLLGVGQDATDQGVRTGHTGFAVRRLQPGRAATRGAPGAGHRRLVGGRVRPPRVPVLAGHPPGRAAGVAERAGRQADRSRARWACAWGPPGLGEVGRVSQPPAQPAPIRRSLVIGGRLFTVSDQGVQAASLATLAGGAFVRFDR